MILISACLVGFNCKYNGSNNLDSRLASLVTAGKAIPFCPEQLGGLPTPRTAVELRDGDGYAFLDGTARALTKDGEDVTENFQKGAEESLKLAKMLDCKWAILKERSPSCGSSFISNGSFEGIVKTGVGATAAILLKNGIKVFSEESLPRELQL